MDKQFLNELMNRRNDLITKRNVRKIDPNHTIKMESIKKKNDDDYLSIQAEDYGILTNILKKNSNIDGNVKIILIDSKNSIEKLDDLKSKINLVLNNNNKNTRGLVYLGVFFFFAQVLITGLNSYLMLEVFNND